MTCQHDPFFRLDNESNSGAGCPRCNQERRQARAALDAAANASGVAYKWHSPDTVALIEQTRLIFEAAEPIPY